MFYADNHCKYTELQDPHRYVFTGTCVATRQRHSVTIPAEELYAYRQGALIQDAMPSLSAEDREFLISGLSPAGWAAIFPKEDE